MVGAVDVFEPTRTRHTWRSFGKAFMLAAAVVFALFRHNVEARAVVERPTLPAGDQSGQVVTSPVAPTLLGDSSIKPRLEQVNKEIEAHFGARLTWTVPNDRYDTLLVKAYPTSLADQEFVTASSVRNAVPMQLVESRVTSSELGVLRERIAAAYGGDPAVIGSGVMVRPESIGILLSRRANDRLVDGIEELVRTFEAETGYAGRPNPEDLRLVYYYTATFERTNARTELPNLPGRWGAFQRGTGYYGCTLGFNFYATSPTRFFQSSAGHCGQARGRVVRMTGWAYDSGVTYGYVNQRFVTGPADALTYPLPSSWNEYPTVTVNGAGGYRNVWGRITGPSQRGYVACFTGLGLWQNGRPDEACGYVGWVGMSATDSQGTTTDLNCLASRSYGGDSGGPVYEISSGGGAYAYGLTTGNVNLQPYHPSAYQPYLYGPYATPHNCYTTIDNAETVLGYKVWGGGSGK